MTDRNSWLLKVLCQGQEITPGISIELKNKNQLRLVWAVLT